MGPLRDPGVGWQLAGARAGTVRTTRPPSPDIINIIQPSLLSADINGNKIFLKTQKLSHINHVLPFVVAKNLGLPTPFA